MGLTIHQVDAFTDRPFAGNPAAVCLLPGPHDEVWMQNVAREINLSETAFLHPEDDDWRLRWFTPAVEVPLCGHATLASAHILWETGALEPDQTARFHTRSGVLTAQRQGDWIEMDFPAQPVAPATVPDRLVEALGATPSAVSCHGQDYLLEFDSEKIVRMLQPDFTLLQKLPLRAVIVTSRSVSSATDFVSRFFAPALGINEDPVTGSAHCSLGPYWQAKLGRSNFTAAQVSARGGIIGVRVQGDRVLLRGQAVTVLRGELSESSCK